METKDEDVFMLCQGCLSSDRNLSSVTGDAKALFVKLRDDFTNTFFENLNELHLCWECIALLNRVLQFQTRIKVAQDELEEYLQCLCTKTTYSLSQLSNTTQNEYNYKYIYEEEKKQILYEPYLEKQPNIIQDQTETTNQDDDTEDEKLFMDIKIENENKIKEEYDDISVNNDTNFYETETDDLIKQETDDVTIVYEKKRKTYNQSIKKYTSLATMKKIHDTFTDNVSQYYETVFLSDREIQSVVVETYRSTVPYKCRPCRLGFNIKIDLLRHKSFQHKKLQYPTPCLVCKVNIKSETHLEQHWKEYHNPVLRCVMCGDLSRTKGELKKHLNRMHTKSYTCKKCSTVSRSLREFSNHYKKSHERCTCDHCGKTTPTKRQMETHIKKSHLPQYCSICNRYYSSHHVLDTHIRGQHPHLLPQLTREHISAELRYCVECDKLYPSVYKYRRHLQQSVRHTPRKKVRIPCPSCDKVFTKVAYKNNHYRLVHIKQSKHFCELCNKYFANGYGVRKHKLRVHQKIPMPKTKICDLCGRGFSTNRILINHRRTHTGERPYKCQYCAATFAQEYAMKTHQKTQHKNF